MAYVLDGIAVLLIVGLGVLGVFRGFFKMIMPVIGVVVSLVLAAQFATPLSEKIYDGLFQGDLTRAVEVKIQEDGGFDGLDATAGVDKLLNVMPEKPKQMMEKYYGAVTAKECLDIVDKNKDDKSRSVFYESGKDSINAVIENVVRPAMINTFTGGCFLALFVVFMALSVFAIVMINRMASLPGLNIINRVLGFIAGAAGGVVLTVVMANALSIFSAAAVAAKTEDPAITPDTLKQTYIVQRMELMKDNETVKHIRDWAIETAKTEAAAEENKDAVKANN